MCSKGTTQVGKVRRPLAAVSKITKAKKIGFFCEDEDWIIDRTDPLADHVINLVKFIDNFLTKKCFQYIFHGDDS